MQNLTISREVKSEWNSHSPNQGEIEACCQDGSVRPGRPFIQKKHVLIVDDDKWVRESLTGLLESEGYLVDEAVDGFKAITHSIHDCPDLVLLDLNMAEIDGWKTFAKLEQARPLLPVVVITARPNQYGEAVRLGVDAFMEKPLNIPLLLETIHHLTSEKKVLHERRITKPYFETRLLKKSSQ